MADPSTPPPASTATTAETHTAIASDPEHSSLTAAPVATAPSSLSPVAAERDPFEDTSEAHPSDNDVPPELPNRPLASSPAPREVVVDPRVVALRSMFPDFDDGLLFVYSMI